jgi:hypothetical protein
MARSSGITAKEEIQETTLLTDRNKTDIDESNGMGGFDGSHSHEPMQVRVDCPLRF